MPLHPLRSAGRSAALALALLAAQGVETGVGDYHLTVQHGGDYAAPIADPFHWLADNLQGRQGSALAPARLTARQLDLDGDRVPELVLSSTTIAGHGETPHYVFKVAADQASFAYIGELGVAGGRLAVITGADGRPQVVTTYQLGTFSVCYHVNDGRRFRLVERDEYALDGERIVGLPAEIVRLFPELGAP
jgi:hypothetical protein